MKLQRLIALLGVLFVLGCSPKEEQPPTVPTATNAKPYPGMEGAKLTIPSRSGASAPTTRSGGK